MKVSNAMFSEMLEWNAFIRAVDGPKDQRGLVMEDIFYSVIYQIIGS